MRSLGLLPSVKPAISSSSAQLCNQSKCVATFCSDSASPSARSQPSRCSTARLLRPFRHRVMSVCETVGLFGRSLVQFPPFRFDPSGQLFFGWQSELIFAREYLIAQIS